ncbi:asparagine synthase (glutamine-hydrolyzing) [Marinobacter sp.]|uniref:asparagine synthase (glutamine-hydrolyzing) n=1 Tax=Marinobacter sp. TaxID=50741 RepID=UPI002B275844|nr:asparagine synthase (glutamine-hydrolyzing) [Marinobacter sp.]
MCGIAGVLSGRAISSESALVNDMIDALSHRGPDEAGYWSDKNNGVLLVHRRLSILDITAAGQQPMHSQCGRYVIAYNGEIYNHLALREALQKKGAAPKWKSHSDTETLLECLASWGVRKTLESLVGMFAFALWDRQTNTLTLARDRMGEKPLYWGRQSGTLLFGSELKALKVHPDFVDEVDRNALSVYLRHNYIPAPHSIYKGIQKLPPGCFVQISASDNGLLPEPVPYWSVNKSVASGLATPFAGSAEEAVIELERAITQSVQGQMLSDVPLGAFLSGGVDSSLIAALMQSQSSKPIKTFAVGFDDHRYNEAEHASAVARHLGTEHTEFYVSAKDALDVIPKLPDIYCEPFADSSQIPTYLVTKLAREHVTVALSGDGGDELFGGYTPYQFVPRYWAALTKVPLSLRYGVAGMMERLPLPDKYLKLAGVMSAKDREGFYRAVISHWLSPDSVVLGGTEYPTVLNSSRHWPKTDGYEHWMMAMESQMYMPEDILVKVDRAAMANSLETRVPLLDHRVVELAWRLPLSMKVREGQGKWVLRQVLYRHVPQSLIERPKKGFSVPMAHWLRGPLRDWAESLLDERRLRNEGYFQPKIVRKAFEEHQSGRRDHSNRLWSILMFQAWLEHQNG